MAYHVAADLISPLSEKTLIELTDDASSGAVDQDVVAAAADSAANIIDGYLRGRVNLPLPSVPGTIKECSIQLAIFWLYMRRMPDKIPSFVKSMRDYSIDILEKIQRSEIELFADDPSPFYRTNKTEADRDFGKNAQEAYFSPPV
jgi:phage gp36-like protein